MNTQQSIIAIGLAASTLITGCAGYDRYPNTSSDRHSTTAPDRHPSTSGYPSNTSPSTNYSSYGVIESIDTVRRSNGIAGTGVGAGAVIGGVVGGVAGNQVGGGTGKTVATVAGAVGGAIVGNEIQKRNSANRDDVHQVRVRLDRGGYVTIAQRDIGDLRVGDQVRIENDVVYRY